MRISTAGMHHAALTRLARPAVGAVENAAADRFGQARADACGRSGRGRAHHGVAARARRVGPVHAQRRHGEESPDPGRAGAGRREHADHARARAHRPGQQRLRRSGEPPHARDRSAQPAERAGGHRQPARRQRRISVFGLRDADAAVRADRRRRSATSATRATARCRSARTSASSTATRAPTCSWR